MAEVTCVVPFPEAVEGLLLAHPSCPDLPCLHLEDLVSKAHQLLPGRCGKVFQILVFSGSGISRERDEDLSHR